MSPIVPMSRIVDDAAQIILEPRLPIDERSVIERVIADEQAALDARRAARAAEQETNQ